MAPIECTEWKYGSDLNASEISLRPTRVDLMLLGLVFVVVLPLPTPLHPHDPHPIPPAILA